ncbi:transmembrane protein 247 [Mus caroli]|uniref:Transmembrane protein 247 n=1 Tax=Mus caroli TaxID=10089 RepID=A0A6P5R2I0_MUSCR|nr:transmembrane protein 247 [Mus caroli]
MAMEDREVMEARGAGESCPTLSKVAPVDSMPEGKPKASLDAEVPKLELPTLEENGFCEDRDCPGPPRSLPPKSSPNAKGQAGDGPGLESVELPLPLETEHRNAMELEKVRMEFELTLLKYLHQENERQRQHEEVMEQLQQQQQQQQQQALPRQFSGSLQDLLLPQNQFAMLFYCFIFIHIIYVAKETVFFLFSKHYLFCLAAILLCLIKTLWSYFQVPLLLPSSLTVPSVC